MNIIQKEMPVLYRHRGQWQGTYRFIDTECQILDQYDFVIDCDFPEPEPNRQHKVAYRQTSYYSWPDGRQQQLCFEASYENKHVIRDNGRIAGKMWERDNETVYLTFRFHDAPDVHVTEMIQISPCGQHRGRTWHWFRKHELYQLTLVSEQRSA